MPPHDPTVLFRSNAASYVGRCTNGRCHSAWLGCWPKVGCCARNRLRWPLPLPSTEGCKLSGYREMRGCGGRLRDVSRELSYPANSVPLMDVGNGQYYYLVD